MEITHYQPPVARNSHEISQIAESIPFTTKDLKTINAARKQTADIASTTDKILADPSHCARYEHFSWLHREVDRFEQILIDEPSYTHAETFHAAILRLEEAKITQGRIGAALGLALQKVSQSVAAVVAGHLDKVGQRIETEASTRRGELATSKHGLFNNSDERRALESRVAQLLADLASERTEAAQDPLGWLTRNGLAMDDITAPQAEDAA
jgi:hypothetical protein